MPSPSVPTFSFPSTTELVFSASTSEPQEKIGRIQKEIIMILLLFLLKNTIAVQKRDKTRTILRQSLPEDHMADFHHLDDSSDICGLSKSRFGGNDESKKIRKSWLNQEFSELGYRIRSLA
ncbi:hypothetical protein Tco_0232680 [Tanacetum coccineum]